MRPHFVEHENAVKADHAHPADPRGPERRPGRGGDAPAALPRSVAMALAALAPSTIFQLPRAGNEGFKFMATFARQLACISLEAGTDLSTIPPVIERLLGELESTG